MPLGSSQTSNSIIVSGFDGATAISVSNGLYSIGCSATFMSIASTINSGQTLCVRHTASAASATTVATTLDIGGVTGNFASTTPALDPAFQVQNLRTPSRCFQPEDGSPSAGDPMSAKTCNANNAAQRLSFPVNPGGSVRMVIADLCVGTPTGNFADGTRLQLQACNGSSTQNFLVSNGRFAAANAPNQVMDLHAQNLNDVLMYQDYGSTNQRWNLVPLGSGGPPPANDTTPDAFSFTSLSNVPPGSIQTSNPTTVSGINAAAPISVTNGGSSYSIGCTATFTNVASTITNGQTVCVRHSASANNSTTVTTTLNIGGVTGNFSSTTVAVVPPPPDTTPDAFSFTSLSNVPLASTQTSNPITVSGINTAATIGVIDGLYSIGCTSTFTDAASTIINGQTVCLRHTASASNSTTVTTTLNIGGVAGSFSTTTLAAGPPPPDTTPDTFSFTSLSNVPLASTQTSNPITVSGINTAVTIGVAGGLYSIGCTATFTDAAGTISNGQTVCLRHTASASNSTTVTTTLNIGGITGSFSSTTLAAAGDPAFQVQNARTPSKCLQPEDGSPSAGDAMSAKACNANNAAQRVSFPVNPNGSFRMVIANLCVGSPSGSFGNGTRLQLQTCNGGTTQNFVISGIRFAAANAPNQVMDLHGQNFNDVIFWQDYGSTNQRWNLVPLGNEGPPPRDTTPDAFSFSSVTNVPLASTQTSNTIIVSGINEATAITVASGLYSIGCTATFTGGASTIANGQTVCVRHTASASNATTVTTTLNIGGVAGSFSSTTLAAGPPPPDTTPDAFSFSSVTNVPLASTQTSNPITVSGIDAAAAITVTGGQYSIGCTATFTGAASTITNGQTVCLRHTASASNATTVTTTLNIGGVTGSFTTTTVAASPPPGGPVFQVRNTAPAPLGKCLQPEDGSPSAGDVMSAKACSASAAQNLGFPVNADGSFRMVITGLCIGSPSGGFGNGTRLQLQTCNGNVFQNFIINGTRFAPASSPSQVMDLHGQNLNDVIFWQDYGSANQRWNLLPR